MQDRLAVMQDRLAVIKVGNMYYAGVSASNSKTGMESFTPSIDKAAVYNLTYRSKSVNALAAELGGTIVAVRKSIKGITDIKIWLKQNMGVVLLGQATKQMVASFSQYQADRGEHMVDVSQYVYGLPCSLRVEAFEAHDDVTSIPNGRYAFAFVLIAAESLTPSQQKKWDALPYGVSLIDNRRLLVEDLSDVMLDPSELRRGKSDVMKGHKSEMKLEGESATPSGSDVPGGISKMSLF